MAKLHSADLEEAQLHGANLHLMPSCTGRDLSEEAQLHDADLSVRSSYTVRIWI